MAADPAASPNLDPSAPLPCDQRFKLRLRFRKGYDLRLLSHHDLMRTFERLLRRADLPVRQSQGFNPKAKLNFALSLPLGVVGCEEVAEIELLQQFPLDELRSRIEPQLPPGLELISLGWVDPKNTAQVRRLTYRISLAWLTQDERNELSSRIDALLAKAECTITRSKPKHREVNVRPFVHDLRLTSISRTPERTEPGLEMELNMTSTGTARPNEILRLLGLDAAIDEGILLERSRLELTDEITSNTESIA